jgi:YD repeat-containing protein
MSYTYLAEAPFTPRRMREALSTYTYNNRHLVTGITYGAGSGVTTPGVNFVYDAAGNRTSMTDGLGSVSYSYNTLSQLTSETRSFTGVGSFTLSCAYNLSGELTSLTNPWSAVVGYNYDKAGRPVAATGSGYAGVTSYASNLLYRAFGLKDMSYGNGKTLSMKYDNRMRPTEWHVPTVMQWDYSYNFSENTGRVTYAKNVDDPTLDRSYDYDQAGRLIVSHSGQEARWHIGTATWAINGPYSQLYGYDQFGNRTHREGWGGSYGASNINENLTYSSNKQVGLSYDAAGNYTAVSNPSPTMPPDNKSNRAAV